MVRLENMERNKTGDYLISLLRSVLTDYCLTEKIPENIHEELFSLALKHNVSNMCLYGIEKQSGILGEELLLKWKQKRNSVIAQSIVQLAERDKILREFADNKVRCLPLKGCLLKEMYPKIDYREMADLDILIDRSSADTAEVIMKKLGYSCERRDLAKDDKYRKDPFMHIELHFELYEDYLSDRIGIRERDFLKNPWNYALETDTPFLFRFSWDYFYVFLIVHLFKHYSTSGVGIRQFLDLWVINQKVNLNHKMINDILDRMNLLSFCKKAEALTNAWMTGAELDEELIQIQEYIFESGSYGFFSNSIKNEIERTKDNGNINAWKYLAKRLFPPLEKMKLYYPILKKYKYLLPFVWIYRLFYKFITNYRKAISEIRILKDYKRKEKEKQQSQE